ncbi:MAG: hypothetical protein HQM13_20910 [SAR324 cluster bacterium]|nr:hypothetical protein [SAR324 cluster bacterium]
MKTRTRKAIEMIPGVTMVVRTMTALGAVYEQFKPSSLDEKGTMLLLKSQADLDAPIRITVNVSEEMAQRYSLKFGVDLQKLKRSSDGSFQLFGNWLKIKWAKMIDADVLELMGCNKLLWDIHDSMSSETASQFSGNAQKLLEQEYTSNVDIIMLNEDIVKGKTLEFPITQEGISRLAREDSPLNIKMLYCLLAGCPFGEIALSKANFETRYIYDPFQKKYGMLHGTMALNQGDENWAETFRILQELNEPE